MPSSSKVKDKQMPYKDTSNVTDQDIVSFDRQFKLKLTEITNTKRRIEHTLYSTKDVSEIFGISKDQVRLSTRQEKLTAIDIGGTNFYTQTELIAYAHRRKEAIRKEKEISVKYHARKQEKKRP